jgi:hypothetical protein
VSGFEAYQRRARRAEMLESLFMACGELFNVRDREHMNEVLVKINQIRLEIEGLPPPDKTHSEH